MTAPTVTEFLLARIAEDERTAEFVDTRAQVRSQTPTVATWVGGPHDGVALTASRVLAECEAKRRIVDLHRSSQETRGVGRDVEGVWTPYCEFDLEAWPCIHASILALPYADHPDYDEAWRP